MFLIDLTVQIIDLKIVTALSSVSLYQTHQLFISFSQINLKINSKSTTKTTYISQKTVFSIIFKYSN